VSTSPVPSSTHTGPRVIGAGYGRTGTASLKRALEILGFGPCHHMEEVVKHPDEVPTWEAAGRGETVDWATFLQGWGSTCDFPSSFYYAQLIAALPDAKVILTKRDPDAWYDSFAATIYPMVTRFPNRVVLPWLPYVKGAPRSTQAAFERLFQGRFEDRPFATQVYREHLAEVQTLVPRERLLVYEVSDGWGPLCAFLGVPVPDQPFPRVNDMKEFQRRTAAMTVVSSVVLALPVVAAAALALGLRTKKQ